MIYRLNFSKGQCKKLLTVSVLQLEHSDAVILLCNKDSDDTKSEDAATILRAVSLGRFSIFRGIFSTVLAPFVLY